MFLFQMRPPGEVLVDLALFMLTPSLLAALLIVAIVICSRLGTIVGLLRTSKPPQPKRY